MGGGITREANKGIWPVLRGWFEYKKRFYNRNRNILGAKIFYNQGLGEQGGTVEEEVFTIRRRNELQNMGNIQVMNITVMDLMDENCNFTDKNGMELKLGFNIAFVEFFRLRKTLLRIKTIVGNREGRIRYIEALLLYKTLGEVP
jgi:hypothetical protein